MDRLFNKSTQVNSAILNSIAHLPTAFMPNIVDASFWQNLSDADFMRIAVLLAQKNYKENEYPIGALIINNNTKKIVGLSHKAFEQEDNLHAQEDHPYNHGATCAVLDAGPIDFSKTTMFITFTPCDVCTSTIIQHQFNRVVIGDITNAHSNEHRLTEKNIIVDILEDQMGIALYKKYMEEQTEAG